MTTLRGAGPQRQGSIDGSHVELPIPITLRFDALELTLLDADGNPIDQA